MEDPWLCSWSKSSRSKTKKGAELRSEVTSFSSVPCQVLDPVIFPFEDFRALIRATGHFSFLCPGFY